MPTPLESRLTSNVIEFPRRRQSVRHADEPRPRWHFVAWSMLCFLLGVILRDFITFTL
jgi:hypothetical protein